MNNLFIVTVCSFLAIFCISGQMARKETREIPSTQVTIDELAEKREGPKVQERKSAARRSMEAQTTIVRKSAAKKAMELEQQF